MYTDILINISGRLLKRVLESAIISFQLDFYSRGCIGNRRFEKESGIS
jgi:hypothetical protein